MYLVSHSLNCIPCYFAQEILLRKGVAKISKRKEGACCVSCLLNHPGELPCKNETVYRFSSGDFGGDNPKLFMFQIISSFIGWLSINISL